MLVFPTNADTDLQALAGAARSLPRGFPPVTTRPLRPLSPPDALEAFLRTTLPSTCLCLEHRVKGLRADILPP